MPNTRTVNNKALSSNIALSAADVGAVPTSRTVNGKALSSNISLTYGDVGAAASSHNHAAGNITSGTLAVARGGTGVTANPSMLVNLGSTSAASVFAASPRPGVTGTLPVARGGTGVTSLDALKTALGVGGGWTKISSQTINFTDVKSGNAKTFTINVAGINASKLEAVLFKAEATGYSVDNPSWTSASLYNISILHYRLGTSGSTRNVNGLINAALKSTGLSGIEFDGSNTALTVDAATGLSTGTLSASIGSNSGSDVVVNGTVSLYVRYAEGV